jgi:hypothetical protein
MVGQWDGHPNALGRGRNGGRDNSCLAGSPTKRPPAKAGGFEEQLKVDLFGLKPAPVRLEAG